MTAASGPEHAPASAPPAATAAAAYRSRTRSRSSSPVVVRPAEHPHVPPAALVAQQVFLALGSQHEARASVVQQVGAGVSVGVSSAKTSAPPGLLVGRSNRPTAPDARWRRCRPREAS